jgi:protein-disulfide isomerase
MTRGPIRIAAAALAVLLLPAIPATAQPTESQTDQQKLWDEIQALKKGQEEMQKELQEIKQLLQGRAAVPTPPDVRNVPVGLGNHPTKGSNDAKVTLIEFSDYQCPFCGRHTRDTNPQLQKEYVETGKVRYVFFDMPLESIHPLAFKAAEAARCAEDQGKYWEMHDRLFANQQKLEPWDEHAKALGLDLKLFDACMASDMHAAGIRADIATAQKLGINGTPSFLVALSDPKNQMQVKGLVLIRGAKPLAEFKTELDKALAPQAPTPAPAK